MAEDVMAKLPDRLILRRIIKKSVRCQDLPRRAIERAGRLPVIQADA